ncbi:MAG TPA: hypothetical protein VEW92_06350 [Nitrososphaeraceae archaeon]|nr:hypothetical protein [Nitrososphaeraceae archaeon]
MSCANTNAAFIIDIELSIDIASFCANTASSSVVKLMQEFMILSSYKF